MVKSSIFRLGFLVCRFIFASVAFYVFRGESYNLYSVIITQSSLFVVLSGFELYTAIQLSSSESDYKEFRYTQIVFSSILGLIIFYYLKLPWFTLFYVFSELLLIEKIRDLNFSTDYSQGQKFNLIFKGVSPILVLLICWITEMNLEIYFIGIGVINLFFVSLDRFKIFQKFRWDFFRHINILQILPFVIFISLYRYLDLQIRLEVNSNELMVNDKNILHLGLTLVFLIEGFISNLWVQPWRNRIIIQKKHEGPYLIFYISIPLLLFFSVTISSSVGILFTTFALIFYRILNSLFLTIQIQRKTIFKNMLAVCPELFGFIYYLSFEKFKIQFFAIYLILVLFIKILYEKISIK